MREMLRRLWQLVRRERLTENRFEVIISLFLERLPKAKRNLPFAKGKRWPSVTLAEAGRGGSATQGGKKDNIGIPTQKGVTCKPQVDDPRYVGVPGIPFLGYTWFPGYQYLVFGRFETDITTCRWYPKAVRHNKRRRVEGRCGQ